MSDDDQDAQQLPRVTLGDVPNKCIATASRMPLLEALFLWFKPGQLAGKLER